MNENRIYFKDNPWPEGHRIKDFAWQAKIVNGDVWFHFHLETENYYAERDLEEDLENEPESDWSSSGSWSNYHRCILSSTYWDSLGFKFGQPSDFSASKLDGATLHIDLLPAGMNVNMADDEQRAFHIYLLGHDTAVDHHVTFTRIGETDLFNIVWHGKIALTYVGDTEPKHSFKAEIFRHSLPKLEN